MARRIPESIMEGVQLLKHQFVEARHKRRIAFIEAVRLVPSRRGHVLTEQEAHQLDIAIELFFATASHAHEIAQKFSNLGILLENFADEGEFSG